MGGGYRLGIDFGTSSTVAMLGLPDGAVRPLLFDASPLLSSGVFASAGGELFTGVDAERAALGQPAGLEPNPKRRIDDTIVWLGERDWPVVDLIAAVLRRVDAEAVRVTGHPPTSVTLTHPAGWAAPRLAVLRDAAARAGFPAVHPVAEPVAAAGYFVSRLGRDLPVGRCLVVYDLGAGTFDVSVVRRTDGSFDVVLADGLPDVGGLDLDAAVVGHVRSLTGGADDAWGRLNWPQTADDVQARQALWRGARAAKEQLSRHGTADIRVPLVDTGVHLTREEFEKVARPLLERTTALTVSVLRSAGVPREEIAGIFLVGGGSRVPLAATLLQRTLGIAPTVLDQPELVVAEGSLYAARPAPVPSPVSGPPGPVPVPGPMPVAVAVPAYAAPAVAQPEAGAPAAAAPDEVVIAGLKRVRATVLSIAAAYAAIWWLLVLSDVGAWTGDAWAVVTGLGVTFVGWPWVLSSLRVLLWPLWLRVGRDGIAMALAGRRRSLRWSEIARVEIGWFEGRRSVLVYLNGPSTIGRVGSGLMRWPPYYVPRLNAVVFHQLRFLQTSRKRLAMAFERYAGRPGTEPGRGRVQRRQFRSRSARSAGSPTVHRSEPR